MKISFSIEYSIPLIEGLIFSILPLEIEIFSILGPSEIGEFSLKIGEFSAKIG